MKRELREKWLELQGADGSCLIKGALALCTDGKVCSCSAGFLLRAAGYVPFFDDPMRWITPAGWKAPDGKSISYPNSPENVVTALLRGTGVNYMKLFVENDIPGTTPEHMIDFIKGLPVDPDTTGDVT